MRHHTVVLRAHGATRKEAITAIEGVLDGYIQNHVDGNGIVISVSMTLVDTPDEGPYRKHMAAVVVVWGECV